MTDQHDWDLILQVQERLRVVEGLLGRPMMEGERTIYEGGFKHPFFQQLPEEEFQRLGELLSAEGVWSHFLDSLDYSDEDETDSEKVYYQFVQYGVYEPSDAAYDVAELFLEISTASDLEHARSKALGLAEDYEKYQRIATALLGEDW